MALRIAPEIQIEELGLKELPPSVERRQGDLVYLIPTVHWLQDVTREHRAQGYKGPDFTLGTVPDSEWKKLQDKGVNLIYFLGIFQRDPQAKKFAERWAHEYVGASPPDFDPQQDILGSAFANIGYDKLDSHVVRRDTEKEDGWREFDDVAKKLDRFGIKVGVDYIPNHTGIGHPRIGTDPDFYIHGAREEFMQRPGMFIDTFLDPDPPHAKRYSPNYDRPFFDGRNIDPRTGKGKEYHIYHGWYQGADFPWEDSAQINLANEHTQEVMIEEVVKMVREHRLSMLRFDMVHLTLRSTFENNWGWKKDQVTQEGLKKLETFWPRLIDRAKREAAGQGRDLICIAEAYWGVEEILNFGFDFVYGSDFYNRQHKVAKGEENAQHVAWWNKWGWKRRRFVHYQENHDEHRAASNEGLRGDAQSRAFATVSAMSDEGMWMVFAGQEEARVTRPPVHTKRVRDESGDKPYVAFNTRYYNRLFDWRKSPLFREGVYTTPEHFSEYDDTYQDLLVQQKETRKEGRISVVNLSDKTERRCYVRLPKNIDPLSIQVFEWNTGQEVRPIAIPFATTRFNQKDDKEEHMYLSVTIHDKWQGQYITFKKK